MQVPSKEPVEVIITQDKLVDLLLHAATREDIARLDRNIANLDRKIDSVASKLDNKINAVATKLDNKIDAIASQLDNKINGAVINLNNKIDTVAINLDNKIDTKIDSLESRISKQFRWIVGTTIAVGVSLCSVMIGLAGFLAHYLH
jgi:predicted transcriptional regulator